MAEQISFMPFYDVQDVYQKNQLGTRLDKTEMMPGVTIISQKASISSIYEAGMFRLGTEFLGSKEHLA